MEQIRRVVKYNFRTFAIKAYVVGSHYEAILISTHNICFMEKYGKVSLNYHQIPSLSVLLEHQMMCLNVHIELTLTFTYCN